MDTPNPFVFKTLRNVFFPVIPNYLLMLFFCANICQSLPLALGVSKVAQIRCLMEYGILKALGPVCAGKVLSSCAKKVMVSLSLYEERKRGQI